MLFSWGAPCQSTGCRRGLAMKPKVRRRDGGGGVQAVVCRLPSTSTAPHYAPTQEPPLTRGHLFLVFIFASATPPPPPLLSDLI